MLKNFLKRRLALVIAIVMIITLVPVSALADTLSNEIDGLTATYTNGTWTASGTSFSGSATGTAKTSCDDATSVTSTLTLKNSKGATAQLSFNYAKPSIASGGYVKIDGTSVTAAGTFTKELAANGTVTVEILSGNPGAVTSSVVLNNIAIVKKQNVTMTFEPGEGGTLKVNGNTVTSSTQVTQLSTDPFALVATADSTHQFMAWYNVTDSEYYFGPTATWNAYFDEAKTVKPVFSPKNTPTFLVGAKLFYDLNEAVSYANSSNQSKIVVYANGTLSAGTYTIPSGKTLLIPYDAAYTLKTTTPDIYESVAASTPSVFRRLNLATGANLVVNGAISVGGKLNSYNNAYTGATSGPFGYLYMNEGSTMTLNNGSNLYCWGYVAGPGKITAHSGSKVYEPFEIADIRGGTATSGMNNNSQKVFPFSQYYVQNIESELTVEYGATLYAQGTVTIQNTTASPQLTFIGSSSGAMFQASSGTSFVKRFDPAEDRVYYDIYGSASINTTTMNVYINVDTSKFNLPLMENTVIRLHGNGTLVTNQSVCMIPGFQAVVDEGCTFKVASGKNVYVYDRDEWVGKQYIYPKLDLKTSYYSPTRANADKFTTAKMLDVDIDLNGTVEAAGYIYTTISGANIHSSLGTGKVVFTTKPTASGTTYQAKQDGTNITYDAISVTAAKLRNGAQYAGTDDEYTLTASAAANDRFEYDPVSEKWLKNPVSITFEANGGEGDMPVQKVSSGTAAALAENQFTRSGYTFTGWNTAANGSGTAYSDGANITISANTTLYAQWEQNATPTYTVTWKNDDGTVLETDENVAEGSDPSYDGLTPVHAADAQYTYTFAGWTPSLSPVTADVVYTATYTTTVNTYTVTWKNYDGSVLKTDTNVPYGTTPSYSGSTPVKPADSHYTYTFSGWTPAVSAVTGNAEYTAVFTETVNTYTVTWIVDGNVETETYEYGAMPAHDDPVKEADAQYTYSFTGWDPAIVAVTGDATYTAQFSQTVNTYTITWVIEGVETTETYEYGAMPAHADPVKEADAQYTYTFTGWDPAIAAVTGDATYTAQFSQTVNTYTITWVIDGVEETETYEYGAMPSHSTPVKAPDAQYTYSFSGWTPSITEVTGNATYTAQFSQTVNTYTITWVIDGVEETAIYEYGAMPAHDDPVKEPDAQYTYTFTGWSPEIAAVTGDAVYTAVFSMTVNKYTIIFENYDGDVLQSTMVAYGATPSYNGEAPVKPADAQYTYAFSGWDPEIAAVTGDAVYSAQFSQTVNTYTITWVIDGVETTETYEYGAMPTHADPEKAATAQYTYTFIGWDPELAIVTGDAVYTAQFTQSVNSYTITWVVDGVEETETYEYGDMPAHDEPTKSGDAQYSYTFTGWTPEITTVTGDAVYSAQFSQTVNTYTITWVIDGVETTETYEYGAMPTHADPTKSGDAQYSYTFTGWTPEITTVTGDATYTAQFDESINQYTVTFVNYDGDVLQSTNVAYGIMPSYIGETPVKPANAQYTYTFAGWTPEIVEVTGDAIYTAQFDATVNTYTITWVIDGVETTETYEYGAMPAHDDPVKEADAQYTYTFTGWTPEITTVTGDATYTAQFTQSVNSYTITWVIDGVEETETYEYGAMPTHADPSKQGDAQYSYTFTGWTPEITTVTSDATYTAQFDESINQYTVTFVNYDGDVLQSTNVAYGIMPSYTGETPVKPADAQYTYTFIGWDPTIATVTGDATYTAQFSQIVNTYTITWVIDGVETTETYEYGAMPAHDDPVKEADAQYTYSFTGWDPAIVAVTGDATYTAQFSQTVNTYTITWVIEGVETTETYEYGAMPAHADPVKEADAQYTYTFAGWTPAIVEVTGDATYTAQFSQTVNTYTITWVIDGVEETETYEYGAMPAHDDPVKEADAQYTYTFTGWTPAIVEVTGDATYTAQFSQTVNTYTITWVVDGVEETETYEYGAMPAHDDPVKEADAQYTYTFAGWTPAIATVTGDATYTAQFDATVNTYTVTFFDKDGNVIGEPQIVEYGASAVAPDAPELPGYVFDSWDCDYSAITGDTEVHAVYTINALKGDMNLDGQITAIDALIALRLALMDNVELTELQIWCGDFNNNSTIDATDALTILRISMSN